MISPGCPLEHIISYILLAVQSIVLLFVDASIPLCGILDGLFIPEFDS